MKFTAIVAALFGLSAVSALDCGRIFSRPNIYKISQERLDRYLNAVNKLNEGPRPTKWDTFARKHIQYYPQVHRTPYFLVWHRFFLHEVEEELRKIDPEVRIPYWDWTVHNANMHEDPVWNIFGKNGEGDDRCVRQGVFRDFRVLYGDDPNNSNGRCLKRRDQFENSFGGNHNLIDNYISNRSDFDFQDDLEGLPHALIHNGIGEEFQGHASPADPLFMSHHAFIDKVWHDRQNRLPETTLRYPLKDNAWIMGYNKQVWQAYDPFGMCYTYTPDNFSWENVRMQSISISSIEVEPYTPLTASNSTSSGVPSEKEEQENARRYITEGIIAPDVNNGPKTCVDGTPTTPVGKIMDNSFIISMKYDVVEMRNKQRKAALATSEENSKCLA
ncbi:Di-copper centre-containing protein [Conidiobolus coronatus NRRL 28638]|uniref:Di-copper centre-containing protein n=1 Tax=Conidiobolus coronatus (strain ATCC 28846 / CBS 209.66 / NRRL 28638) TaxID=796925 RepID=A0A137P4L3_CONC2|nr:Di-copper centre-containing protein [Conidiobolus coronatus NRRL 28638]|eukprot:KXN69933.1 Di-copper centre-containing protein [Conidiobolus coronatus NRRL 28638]